MNERVKIELTPTIKGRRLTFFVPGQVVERAKRNPAFDETVEKLGKRKLIQVSSAPNGRTIFAINKLVLGRINDPPTKRQFLDSVYATVENLVTNVRPEEADPAISIDAFHAETGYKFNFDATIQVPDLFPEQITTIAKGQMDAAVRQLAYSGGFEARVNAGRHLGLYQHKSLSSVCSQEADVMTRRVRLTERYGDAAAAEAPLVFLVGVVAIAGAEDLAGI